MIGPSGLLLVVPHLFAVPISVSCGLQNSTELNLDVKNILAGSYTEHSWSVDAPRVEKFYVSSRRQHFV
jgi:hypothetical protein